jgi:hypothetical protein
MIQNVSDEGEFENAPTVKYLQIVYGLHRQGSLGSLKKQVMNLSVSFFFKNLPISWRGKLGKNPGKWSFAERCCCNDW